MLYDSYLSFMCHLFSSQKEVIPPNVMNASRRKGANGDYTHTHTHHATLLLSKSSNSRLFYVSGNQNLYLDPISKEI